MSSSPLSNIIRIAPGSVRKRRSSPSLFGAPAQQFGFAVRIMPFPASHSCRIKDPVPTVQSGSLPKDSPAASVVSLSRMEAPGIDKQARKASNGFSSVMEKVMSSMTRKPSSSSVSPLASASAPTISSAISRLQDSGCVSSRLNVYSTSFEVSGDPLLKLTPFRSRKV